MSARGPAPPRGSFSTSGMRYASVLPDPVLASMTTSRPASRAGMASAWTWTGSVIPCLDRDASRRGPTPASAKEPKMRGLTPSSAITGNVVSLSLSGFVFESRRSGHRYRDGERGPERSGPAEPTVAISLRVRHVRRRFAHDEPAQMNVLVTGGTGALGRHVVTLLLSSGHRARILSRNPRGDMDAVRGDLATGAGLVKAVAGMDAIIHAASAATQPTKLRTTDVLGTRRLLAMAREEGVRHVVYISIVGMEGIAYPYYKAKLATEAVVQENIVPWSILRATQFHTLMET